MAHLGKILIVDDDDFSSNLYADLLREEGHKVLIATTSEEGLAVLGGQNFDLVITEIVKPQIEGFDIINFIHANHPQVDVIVATAFADIDTAIKVFRSGAKDYFQKPVNVQEFKLTINRYLEQKSFFTENIEFRRFLDLFDACHRISGCLEKERLIPLSLHVLGQELRAQDVIALMEESRDNTLNLVPLNVGPDWDLGKLSRTYCSKLDISNILDCRELMVVDNPEYPPNVKKTLVLPVLVNETIQVVYFLFYLDEFSTKHSNEQLKQKANFLGRQISLSMDNALKYNQARERAFIDDLSGLYNSRYLKIVLEKELKRSKRFDSPLSVLFLDLDHFKKINDEHGHLVGSRVLVEVAKVLNSCLREIDTAVRYGGDEYTIILVNTKINGAKTVAERIRSKIEETSFLKNQGLNLKTTASIGIACYPDHAQNVDELVHMADLAMYRGKNSSRNVVYIFEG